MTGQKHKILVCDGDQKHTLGIVRSLGQAGHEVGVLSGRKFCASNYSSFTAREHILPDLQDKTCLDALVKIINAYEYDIL